MDQRHHFLAVLPRDRVAAAMAGAYIEVGGGRSSPLARLATGDIVVFYSPRATDAPGPALQHFTAVAQVVPGRIYEGEPRAAAAGDEGATERPCRRGAVFLGGAPAAIRPLIATLDFIRDKQHWGVALRYGFVQISAGDFARVAVAMGCQVVAARAQPA